jgi:protein-L-isoaspartate(D-aspartate) O-methyltransferase
MVNTGDGYREKGLRRQLVETLKKKGIHDQRVLDAINSVPRHQFIDDSAFLQIAYEDKAFPIGQGQTISQPYTVAFQTQLLQLEPGMKVLEIGTGSGYQTAVLAALGVKIFSIERQRPLYVRTKERLAAMKVKANLFYGDGYLGLPKEAPFDRVLVTCGAPHVPETLIKQLRTGGRAVIPVGEGNDQEMVLIERSSPEEQRVTKHGKFRFVPMLEQKAG